MENYSNRIKLYEQREFGEKLNVTFDFLRKNAKDYFKAQFYIAGPVAIILTILYTILFQSLFSEMENMESGGFVGFSDGSFWNTMATYFMTILFTFVVTLVSYAYMKAYHDLNGEHPSVNTVFQIVMQNFWKALVVGIIWVLFITIGMLFLILPGIYLAVVSSLAFPILINENAGIEDAIGRCFRLIREKWFSTFGLLVVTGIIGMILSALIAAPVSIFAGVKVFLGIEEGQTNISDSIPAWVIGLGALLGYAGNIVSGAITNTAIAFQYYNLVEMKESRGLLSEIDKMDENREEDSANEGRY